MKIVVLAGGTGGAKLAAGMQELASVELSVIANTADDVEFLGVHVSPDPDLCIYWLSGEIDEQRGWGIRGDSFTAFKRLVELGAPDWFWLSDRDLATCLRRHDLMQAGARQTEAQDQIARALGIRTAVLPMCDEPVRTRVRTTAGWRGFQEYLILDQGEPAVEAFELEGIGAASPTPEVRQALAQAEAIVIGPSNPVVSIGPILAVPGLRDAIRASPAPVVAVSPFVAGRAIKGPTEKFMATIGVPATAAGVAGLYADLIAGLVVDGSDPDPPPASVRTVSMPTLMHDAASRKEVAERTLSFARELAAAG
jgi:LPPG:FO 2-phospho-L-lactate transferase